VRAGVGTIANKSASAYFLGDYARSHGWVTNFPQPGDVVVYHLGQGHVGIVERVISTQTFDAIEGNEGNAVRRVRRNRSQVYCFFVPPGTTKPPRVQLLPRFEVVSSSSGHAVVRARWGKWSKVGPQIPRLVKKYRVVRVRRRLVKVKK
jgi:hypothetical protein